MQHYVGSVIRDVLQDKEVNQSGLDFLDRAFRHPQTHEAGLVLLINALNDPRFLDHSKTFSTELIAWVVQQPQP
jgi:hypothetical protein